MSDLEELMQSKGNMLFAKIPHEAIESIGDPEALAVYCGLMRFARFRNSGSTYTNGVWVSDKQLSTMLGMEETRVADCKDMLRAQGWIDWATHEDGKTRYMLEFS